MQETNNLLNKMQLCDGSIATDSVFDDTKRDEGISVSSPDSSCRSPEADGNENDKQAVGWASVYKKLRKIALLKQQAKNNRMSSSTSTGESIDEILENFRHLGAERTDNDVIESRMFEQSKNKFGFLDVARFIRATRKTGLNLLLDPRLTDTRINLDACQNYIIENVDDENVNTGIDFNCFKGIINNNSDLLSAAYDGQLVIGDFDHFQSEIMKMHEQCAESVTDGGCTDYTEYLNQMNPNAWGVSICTIDGQRCSFGDSREMFTMQALANPIIYAAVLSELGADAVHKLVGQEASGCHNKKIRLDKEGRPHNPLINAGAILMSSQFKKNVSYSTRHNETLKMMRQAAGITNASINNASSTVGFDYAGFMAERATCHRNASICYFMREKNCFPEDEKTETNDVLDFYTQTQNVTVNCDSLSVMAATLANGGVCPITGESVFSNDDVKSSLSCMLAAGMNDYSGQWAYRIGLPAKSGISGGLMIVVPNVMGIALYSPSIDKSFNSTRALEFARKLVNMFHFHEFDPIRSKTVQSTPMMTEDEKLVINLIAAQRNDVYRIKQSFLEDVNLNVRGYDNRTPLHVAASHGSIDVVVFLVAAVQVDTTIMDKFGYNACDLAQQAGHDDITEYLLNC